MPSQFSRQGLYEGNIVIRVIPKEAKPGETSITATVAVISKLSVMVPYSGKYVTARLFVPMFEPNKESKFAVDVSNLGTEDAEKVKAIIDIYGPLNDKLSTVVSEEATLKSKEKKMIIVPYTPNLRPGNYKAVVTVIADEFNAKDERAFSLGTISVNVDGITVDNFKLGGIARFDILLENVWNEKIPDVYGEVSILDKSGNVYTKFKTASVDIDSFEKQELQAYWDTAKVTPGEYKLSIALQYLGQSSEKVFDILVSMNEIKTSLVGKVVAAESKDKNIILTAIYILTALVIILIVLNVLIYFRKLKK
jgi:methionine-rich copper-binding protein CopC